MAIEGALQPWPGTCPPWKVYLDEEEHKYTVTNYTKPYYKLPWDSDAPPTSRHIISGTGLLHKYFPQFDAEACLDQYYDNWQKPGSKRVEYKGKTREEIKEMWAKNGRDAAALGTAMHLDCELYYTENKDADRDTDEWRSFLKFVKEVLPKERMLVPEMKLFSPEHRLCGTADIIAVSDRPGHIKILDYKRSKHTCREDEFVFGKSSEKYGFGPCSRIKNNANGHYTVQLNLYRVMLMQHYGVKIESMELVRLYPKLPSYQLIPVPIIEDVILKILDERKRQLKVKRLFKVAATVIWVMIKFFPKGAVYPTQLTQNATTLPSLSSTRDITHVSKSIVSEVQMPKRRNSDSATSSAWTLSKKRAVDHEEKSAESKPPQQQPRPTHSASSSEWSLAHIERHIQEMKQTDRLAIPQTPEELSLTATSVPIRAAADTVTIDRALYEALVEHYKVTTGFIDKKSRERLEIFRNSL